jgi:phospholipase/lecithinase/hemolysin
VFIIVAPTQNGIFIGENMKKLSLSFLSLLIIAFSLFAASLSLAANPTIASTPSHGQIAEQAFEQTIGQGKASPPFSKIIFFGDSLTDNGNLYSTSLGVIPKSPPYFKGRFSNGEVWSDLLQAHYFASNSIATANYAVGGETAILHNPTGGFLPYTLTMSLDSYLLRTTTTDRSKTLFIIFVGANDYLPGFVDLDDLSTKVTNSIRSTLESLIYHGGKYFLVLNLPDLSKTPFSRQGNRSQELHAATLVNNLKLAAAIEYVEKNYKNVQIKLFDSDAMFNDFIEHIDRYNTKYNTHVNNLIDSCWKGGYTFVNSKLAQENLAQRIQASLQFHANTPNANGMKPLHGYELADYISSSPSLQQAYNLDQGYKLGEKPCTTPDDYLFWDHLHPSTVAHMLMSKLIIEFIDQNYLAS